MIAVHMGTQTQPRSLHLATSSRIFALDAMSSARAAAAAAATTAPEPDASVDLAQTQSAGTPALSASFSSSLLTSTSSPVRPSASQVSLASSTDSQQQQPQPQQSPHPQVVALRKLDALSEKLQKEGKLLEALQCMEKSLLLRGQVFGPDSIEVSRACKSVAEMCNFMAMTMLQQGQSVFASTSRGAEAGDTHPTEALPPRHASQLVGATAVECALGSFLGYRLCMCVCVCVCVCVHVQICSK